jgi:hypothetical protein
LGVGPENDRAHLSDKFARWGTIPSIGKRPGVRPGEFAIERVWAVMAMVSRYATYSISINGRLGWNQ